MKQPFRRAVSALCAFTLAASLMPSVALADRGGESAEESDKAIAAAFSVGSSEVLEGLDPASAVVSELFEDVTMDDAGRIALYSEGESLVPLKEGNFEWWIDRIDSRGVPIERAYARLEEACDNDGVEDYLIEDKYFNGEAEQGGWFIPGKDSQGNVIPALVLFAATPTETFPEETLEELLQVYTLAVVSAFDRDHPEVFWMLGGFRTVSFTGTSNGTKHLYYAIVLDSDRRSPLYPDETAVKKGIESRDRFIASIMEGAPDAGDPEGRIRYFNDWLTKHNEYNTTEDLNDLLESNTYNDAWECISALEGREGTQGPVCEAYSRAFKVLCDESCIPCVLVNGIACGPDGPLGGHMWNYVKLGEGWYGTDVTWNDPATGRENDNWLLVGADTPFYGTMSFITTHPVLNAFFSGYLFPNGPKLSADKYVRDCSKMGHVAGQTIVQNTVAPTCEKNGTYDEVTSCKYCQEIVDTKTVENPNTPAMGHQWNEEWVETQSATCTTAGKERLFCLRDGSHFKERAIPATGHKMGDWETVKAATCDESGSQQRRCSQGGCSHVETQSQPALGHKWGEWVVRDATCTEAGEKVRVCEHDTNHIDRDVLPALGHKVETGEVEGATCTEDGTVSGVCSVCGAEGASQVVPGTALGHNWGAWKVTTAPTCTVSGVEERICSRDGSHRETRVIRATGHDLGAWETTRAATCTVPGSEVRRCAHAGCSYTETRAVAATGHAFGAYRSNGDARVGANGTETATCSKCGAKTTRTAAGSALAPAQGQTVTVGGASYTVAGSATVAYAGPASKAAASATVPATVKVSGRTYKVTSISPKAFAGNKKLKSVKIGANVTAIPAGAFKGCTALSKVTFGAAVKSIGSKAFYGCKSLKSVTLGAKVTSIGASAFQNCAKLTKVTVKSAKLKTVGKSAFAGCKKLKTVSLKTTKLKSVGKNALKGAAKKLVVKVPKSKVRAYQKLFKNKGTKTVRVTK